MLKNSRTPVLLIAAALMSACASTGALIDPPKVNLTSVELVDASLVRQTFHLGFAIDNPNAFPLPVRAIEYEVFLDDEKFASGETEGSFTVPGRGNDDITISVDLDFLKTASNLSSLLQHDLPDAVNYELQGSFTVDIPFARPLPFSSSGIIRTQ